MALNVTSRVSHAHASALNILNMNFQVERSAVILDISCGVGNGCSSAHMFDAKGSTPLGPIFLFYVVCFCVSIHFIHFIHIQCIHVGGCRNNNPIF
jgi:hypothetical protein